MKQTAILLLIGILMTASGCTLFGDDEVTSGGGWKNVSMPTDLTGTWQVEENFTILITGSKVTMHNRPWAIMLIQHHPGDDEYRLIVNSRYDFLTLYFRNLSGAASDFAESGYAFTLYDAKIAGHGAWTAITKVTEN